MARAHVDDVPPDDLDLSNDGTAIATANSFIVATARTIHAIWAWIPTTNTGTYTLQLYEITGDDDPGPASGTLLASESVAAADVVAGQWNRVEIDPVGVVTTKAYRVSRHSSSGRFVRTGGAFSGAQISNGGITLVESGTNPNSIFPGVLRNGVFREGAAGYPSTVFGQPDYYVDVDDAPLAGDTVEVAGTQTVTAVITGVTQVDRNVTGDRSATGSFTATLKQTAGITGTLTGTAGISGSISVRSDLPAEATTNSAGWYGYLNIIHNNAEETRRQLNARPEACPDCGEPLDVSNHGVLFCPFDGWTWNGFASVS